MRVTTGEHGVMLHVENSGDRYAIVPGASRVARHPLLEAAIDELAPPDDLGLEVSVRSAIPAGCGTGTSAAVAVGLLGGLAAVRSEQPSPRELAYAAHRLEVDVLGLQSGIATSLTGKLNAALAAATAGDLVTACRKLQDFINETHAQAGKKISTGDAASLIATAQRIRAVLGC